MKPVKNFLALLALISITTCAFSQDTRLLDTLPVKKDDFIKSEPAVINTVDWLVNTPLNQETDKRKLLTTLFTAWVINSPTVTIELNSKIVPVSKKNPELLVIFMAGWTKYSLQNSYSKDIEKGSLAGIKSLLKVYNSGIGIKKDKEIEKLAELDSKNELETWVAAQLSKK